MNASIKLLYLLQGKHVVYVQHAKGVGTFLHPFSLGSALTMLLVGTAAAAAAAGPYKIIEGFVFRV